MKENVIKIKPHFIVFEKENLDNGYVTFVSQMKPRVKVDDEISKEEYEHFRSRREEIQSLIEEKLAQCYFDSSSEDCLSGIDFFPDIRLFTGNYYLGSESYGVIYRDKNNRPYDIKNGQFCNVSYDENGRKDTFLPLDSAEITKYYHILISVRLTEKGTVDMSEDDYMELDLSAELKALDDKIEFEILSHNVI